MLSEETLGTEGVTQALMVDQLLVGRFAVFSYVLTDAVSGEAAILDPGAEPGRILDRVRERGATVRWMISTHAHPDHVGAGAALLGELDGVDVAMHGEEARRMGRWWYPLLVRLLGGKAVRRVDRMLEDGDRLPLGEHVLEILHTPGHSPGSVCVYTPGHLFTGDTLFVGGVGRTDLPGGCVADLSRSLRSKILSLPGATRIWPGHDYGRFPSRLLEEERCENPFIRWALNGHGERVG